MKVFVYLSLAGLLSVSPGQAIAAVADEQPLLDSCTALAVDPAQQSATLCNYYVQGYVSGAAVNDRRNAAELADASRQWSAFMQRVYRTRVGSKDERAEATPFLHFCIPRDAELSEVIGRLSTHLAEPIATARLLRETLYDALQQEYPCSQ